MCGEPILSLGQLIMAALDAVVPFVLPLSQTAPAVGLVNKHISNFEHHSAKLQTQNRDHQAALK